VHDRVNQELVATCVGAPGQAKKRLHGTGGGCAGDGQAQACI
jgi:hypothetical protein